MLVITSLVQGVLGLGAWKGEGGVEFLFYGLAATAVAMTEMCRPLFRRGTRAWYVYMTFELGVLGVALASIAGVFAPLVL